MSPEIVKGRWTFAAYPDDLYLGQAVSVYGEYGQEEAEFLLDLIEPDSLVVEIGANAGYLTVPLASKARMIAVEPQLQAFELLCQNIQLNGLGSKVMPIHAACGASKGEIWMPDIGYETAGNHGGLSASPKQFGRFQIKTPLLTVDSLVKERVSLIKIDVEGMEHEVLEGALETIALYRPLIYCENDREEKSEALINYLIGLGYDCAFHTPELFNPNNFFKNPVNLWPNVVSINMICAPQEQKRIPNPIGPNSKP